MIKVSRSIRLGLLFIILLPTIIISSESSDISVESPNIVRITTYNIRRKWKEAIPVRLWQNRLSLVQALIKKIDPDILGLQEATTEQKDDLQKDLPEFGSIGQSRGKSWWGFGTDEWNPLFYRNDKVTLLESDTFPLNASKGFLGWMPWQAKETGWLPRICTWGKFKMKATNKEFYVYNTHLDHMYALARIRGAQVVIQHIKEHKKGLPVIITGDFNTEFTGEIKEIFADFQHVKDIARKQSGPRETATGWENKEPKWIDHILISKGDGMQVLDYGVVEHEGDIYPSDHRPVFADILFK